MMGHQTRSESLFYYFRLEDQIPGDHLLRLIDQYIDLSFVRERLKGGFLFATEDGTISGWAPLVDPTHAFLAVDNSAPGGVDGFTLGAVYKGLAVGNNGSGNFIYATNFRDGVVEIYDGKFSFVNSFTDPTITPDTANPGFAPFGIRNINGKLYVTFALQNAERHDDVKGPGNGFVDVFDLNGSFLERFATGGALNSPWGDTNQLFFTAGIQDESHGLFGKITAPGKGNQ